MLTGRDGAEVEPLDAADPRQVGDYLLEGRLGAGGMGVVYLGRSHGDHRVAVKVIHPHHVRDPKFRARFRHEVDAARRVQSLFTAQVLAADPEATAPWIATRYIHGPSLACRIEQDGPLGAREVAEVAAGTAEALAAIHAADVIHRDLKPQNILLAADGPHIIDFGIARAIDHSVLTGSGILGTPAFMSPEQARSDDASPASDIFSLGCTIYYAATGQFAFGTGQPWAVLLRVISAEPDLDRVADASLRDLVAQCLAKDPGSRPTTTDIIDHLSKSSRCASKPSGEPASQAPTIETPASEMPASETTADETTEEPDETTAMVVELVGNANDLHLRREDVAAEAMYREAIRLQPDYALAHYNLGVMLRDHGRFAEAIAEVREAICLKMDSPWVAYAELGGIFWDAGLPRQAEREVRYAIRLKRDDGMSHAILGGVLRDAGRFEEAEAELRAAIRLGFDHAWTYNLLGRVMLDLRRPAEAEPQFRESIRRDPGFAWAHCNLGLSLKQTGRYDEARHAFEEALRLDPGNATAKKSLQ